MVENFAIKVIRLFRLIWRDVESDLCDDYSNFFSLLPPDIQM